MKAWDKIGNLSCHSQYPSSGNINVNCDPGCTMHLCVRLYYSVQEEKAWDKIGNLSSHSQYRSSGNINVNCDPGCTMHLCVRLYYSVQEEPLNWNAPKQRGGNWLELDWSLERKRNHWLNTKTINRNTATVSHIAVNTDRGQHVLSKMR
jgi:hypothetical protein